GVDDDLRELAVDPVSARGDELALGILDLLREQAAEHAVFERLLTERVVGVDEEAVLVTAVLDADDDVLRDVHQTSREVARVGRPDGGVGETLAATVRGDEVLEDGQAFAEVRADRQVDDPALRVRDETTHATDLPHALLGTP